MAKDYALIANQIIENIGGIENVESVTHCMTRLRFVLKDESLADDATVKKINGVMGVVRQGGQYQVIIGNNVAYAYKEIVKLGNFGEASDIAKGTKKQKLTPKVVGNNILDALISTMSPIVPAIIDGSMIKLLVIILGMLTNCPPLIFRWTKRYFSPKKTPSNLKMLLLLNYLNHRFHVICSREHILHFNFNNFVAIILKYL